MYKLVLASNSPRRKELLGGLGWPFEVRVAEGVAESYPTNLQPAEVATHIAREKASAYRIAEDELLITADTIVVLGTEIMGKPSNASDAARMLHELSGKTHQVITGVCLTTTTNQRAFAVTTDVTFKELTEEEIIYYVGRFAPYDKAGSYGIQEWIGYIGVTTLQGSYFNVMGLPVQRIYNELRNHYHMPLPGEE